MNVPILTPEELTRRVLIEHWREVYGPTHPIIGARLWTPQCQECRSDLVRDDALWRCQEPSCGLCGVPAPADMGIPEIAALREQDEVLHARLGEGHRTSQHEAFTDLGPVFTPVIGGNRSGKSVGGGMLGSIFAMGRDHPATQVWAHDNGFDLEQIPNRGPGLVYAISPTHEDSNAYTRPTAKQFFPAGTVLVKWKAADTAYAHFPGPNGEPPNTKAKAGEPGFYGRIAFKAVRQGREAFQGAELVLAWFDEEPLDPDVFGEVETRCADQAGKIVLTMTPLSGFTYLYHLFIRDRDKRARVHELTGLHNPTGDHPDQRAQRLAQQALTNIRQGKPERARQRIYGVYGDAQGLVYPMFSEHTHVFDSFDDLPPREECEVWGGFDDGTVNPLCYLHAWYHPPSESWYILEEIYGEQMLLSELAEKMRAAWGRWGSPRAIFADSAAAKTILEMRRAHRINMTPCKKGAGSVREQIRDVVQPVLSVDVRGDVHYFVHRSCVHHRQEFSGYAWPKGTDRRAPKENPIKVNDHSMDAMRYLLSGVGGYRKRRRAASAIAREGARVFGSGR